MARYNTGQRKRLLEYLKSNADSCLSASHIADALKDEEISISAVYRNLSDLEKSGKIRKLSQSGTRESLYQYIDIEQCKDKLHLSCVKCGKIFHLNNNISEKLLKEVSDLDDFAINKSQSILYGTCGQCKK